MCFSVQVDVDLMKISKKYNAEIPAYYFKEFGEFQKKHPKLFKTPSKEGVIYPNTFAGVMVQEKGNRIIRPMRYRLRPHWSEKEIPSKYNLFNARLDSLENRKSWKGLLGQSHGVFVFKKFYEWVDRANQKTLVHFIPEGHDMMAVPALVDHYFDDDYRIDSFAIITDDPPKEVLEAGHDRCPIFLNENGVDQWLEAKERSPSECYQILEQRVETFYSCREGLFEDFQVRQFCNLVEGIC